MGGPEEIRRLPMTDRLEAAARIAGELGCEKAKQRCAAMLIVRSLVEESDKKLEKALMYGQDTGKIAWMLERTARLAIGFGLGQHEEDRIRVRLALAYGDAMDLKEEMAGVLKMDKWHFMALGISRAEHLRRMACAAEKVGAECAEKGCYALAGSAYFNAIHGMQKKKTAEGRVRELAEKSVECLRAGGLLGWAFDIATKYNLPSAQEIGLLTIKEAEAGQQKARMFGDRNWERREERLIRSVRKKMERENGPNNC